MEKLNIDRFSFSYPAGNESVIDNVSITVNAGEFITLCGPSGCGKSTFLRNLKPSLAPKGEIGGRILFDGKDIKELSQRDESSKIGFILQNPDSQIVTDKVWHELAFGLESLGYSNSEICARVAEMASFFGISEWFYKNVNELSGGQKQLLNLASVMAMQPELLVLDEPTGQLDPIAAGEFLGALSKVNRELGITIIISEHRLEECFALSDRVLAMDCGRIIADGTPKIVGKELLKNNYFKSFPTPMRVFAATDEGDGFPVSISEGRNWLSSRVGNAETKLISDISNETDNTETAVEINDVYFRYEKNGEDVLSGLSLKINKGGFYAILGANGAGKTTALSIITGEKKPTRGSVYVADGKVAALPQNPDMLFVKKTVLLDLYDILSGRKLSNAEKDARVNSVIELCKLGGLTERHPYDLSGGEKQRAALAKVLLLNPDILLLDEPTKGLDGAFKEEFAEIIATLNGQGVTVVMVTHDIEFCARHAEKCGLIFDGKIVSEGTPREFFAGKSFYTTAANRMSRGIIGGAVLAEDIIAALGGRVEEKTERTDVKTTLKKPQTKEEKAKFSPKRIAFGIIFAIAAILAFIILDEKFSDERLYLVYALELLLSGLSLNFLLPKKVNEKIYLPKKKKKLSKSTIVAVITALIAVPATIFVGIHYLGDRKYLVISMLIILEILVPFLFAFESRRPSARELIVISVLCAIAVVGRSAFYMLPQFKPALAIIILSAVAFGGETGFLVGAMYAFVSNFFFGQGPWTPWQMFTHGIIGFVAGILSDFGVIGRNRTSLSVFGAFAAVVIFGGIMNPASVIMYQTNLTPEMFYFAYIKGIPFDLIHAFSTVFFLWFISEPMLEKLDRIKIKYGIYEQ